MDSFKGFGEKAFPFLKALDFHQSREWFVENKDLFETELREPLGDLVDTLTVRFEAAGIGLKGDHKKSLFRINRDVRFAKDKRPYNRHVSAILSPDGSKMEQGVFFVHIGLERCFAAIAWWGVAPELLLAMRRAIADRPGDFRAMTAALKRNGLELGSEGAMKRMPRGFEQVGDADLAAAIRNRHFVVRQEIDPAGIHTAALADELYGFVQRARPLLEWGRAIEGKTAAQ
ncbi:MAG TPA: TIGR02453 family protein [Mesorhizobium sp.]